MMQRSFIHRPQMSLVDEKTKTDRNMRLIVYVAALAALCSLPCGGYPHFQKQIPNGQQVPHPCKPNYIWHGVGHLNPMGGGARNPFGVDFANHGFQWSKELCELDSDNDGMTNGQELGDPNCVWSGGHFPEHTKNLSHPGICSPWGSPHCEGRSTFVTCDLDEFKCDAVNDPDVRKLTLHFPRTKVPIAETTYRCFIFDLPSDQAYHLVATKPFIDNTNVVHHITLIACSDSTPLMSQPGECKLADMGCSNNLAVWGLGMPGDCLHPDAGFRIGKGSFKRVAIQLHWTNKIQSEDYDDASGMTLYYTAKLRPYDAGIFATGQMYLNIPPGSPSVTFPGSCSPECTRRFIKSGSIKIFNAWNHMHYLGIGGRAVQIRDGKVIATLTNDQPFLYDSPNVFNFQTPIEVLPGDELRMTCQYSSLTKNITTIAGSGTFDEMCNALFTYFPRQGLGSLVSCLQWKDLDACDFLDGPCNINTALNSEDPAWAPIVDEVLANCGPYGECNEECPPVIARLRQVNPCLSGTMWEFLRFNGVRYVNDVKLLRFISAIDLCDRDSMDRCPR